MKIIRVSYLALAAILSAASCSQEAAEPDVYDWADGDIYFRPSLAEIVTSRAQDMTLDRLESFQVSCFNTADTKQSWEEYLRPYFQDVKVDRKEQLGEMVYEAAYREIKWPDNDGLLRFFAFSPSFSYPSFKNTTTVTTVADGQNVVSIGYRLENIRINSDTSQQFDFITAEATGKKINFIGGINLAFGHRLCQIELRAWGDRKYLDLDIAGVRIGNAAMKGTFVFADDSNKDFDTWEVPEDAFNNVEYFYKREETNVAADAIFSINSDVHNKAASAASIMGQGGCAMLIPTKNGKWEGKNDPNIGTTPYSTQKMYFSVLIRAKDRATGLVVYPYPDNRPGMNVVSYAVNEAGNVVCRLYRGRGSNEGKYYRDSGHTITYNAPNGVEIMDFGWAAVPVEADWKAGKRYVYTLDYSNGIGLHDPSDADPGTPIAGLSPAILGVSVEDWTPTEKGPDFVVPGN